MDALEIPNSTESTLAPHRAEQEGDSIPLRDWIAAGVIVLVMLVLKAFYIHSLPWHSDEPQHMHVVWSWASGRLPYRDVFDNHSPLFGFSMSPLFRLVGERNDIVDTMRWFMLPLFALSVWCIYRMGAIVASRRAGLWAALVSGFFPLWFLKMGEFRTDVLWTTLWLVTLLILVSGKVSLWRMFAAGLALGATFSVSMKSTLMLLTIIAAGAMVAGLRWISGTRPTAGSVVGWLGRIGAAIAGLLVIPGAFVGFFASKGMLDKMYYCVIQHNLTGSHSAGRILRHFVTWHSLFIPLTLAVGWASLRLFKTDPHRAARRLFLLGVTGLFCPILEGVWTNVTPQDYMPLWPLAGGFLVVLFVAGFQRLPVAPKVALALQTAVFVAVVAVEAGLAIYLRPPHPKVLPNIAGMEVIKEARALTRPDEFLMDPKGESIYRQRPYWYVLETLTRKRLFAALDDDAGETPKLTDDLPQTLIDTRCAVVLPSIRMMEKTRKFVDENYVAVGMLHVLGKKVAPSKSGVYAFDLAVPERYTVVNAKGELVPGDLDGTPFNAPRELAPGHHEFRRTSGEKSVAVIWARSVEKGYSPFHQPTYDPLH